MKAQMIGIALGGLLVGLVIGTWIAPGSDRDRSDLPHDLVGVVLPEPQPLTEFLPLDRGSQTPFALDDLDRRWTLLFYGYTACPDVCPGTLSAVRGAVNILREAGHPEPQVVFVSVDPGRDTPQTTSDYARYFDEAFVGVAGDGPAVASLARQMGAMYLAAEPDADGQYEVAHPSVLFLVDPQVRLTAGFGPPHLPEDLARKFTLVYQRYERMESGT